MNQKNKISWKDKDIYIGLDVHKKTWRVAICTEEYGVQKHTYTIRAPFVSNLISWLNKHYPGGNYHAAHEAGFIGFWIVKKLNDNGIKALIFNASDIPSTDKDRKQKEDGRCARRIAKALKNGDLSGIYIPSDADLRLRELVREREKIQRKITALKNQIRSYLSRYNLYTEDDTDKYWSSRFIAWLEEQSKNLEATSLELQLKQLRELRKTKLEANRKVRYEVRNGHKKEICGLLKSIPGIGDIWSAVVVSELCEMVRFTNTNELNSYVGLIPRTSSSGEQQRTGGLTTRSNKRVKTALVEASWIAIGRDTSLLLYYENLKKRMKGQQAIVRVARKLLARIRWVWINKEAYELCK